MAPRIVDKRMNTLSWRAPTPPAASWPHLHTPVTTASSLHTPTHKPHHYNRETHTPIRQHAQRLRFSYKPRCVRRLSPPCGFLTCPLAPTQWRASHKATPHSRLFSHSILTARGSISGRDVRLWPQDPMWLIPQSLLHDLLTLSTTHAASLLRRLYHNST